MNQCNSDVSMNITTSPAIRRRTHDLRDASLEQFSIPSRMTCGSGEPGGSSSKIRNDFITPILSRFAAPACTSYARQPRRAYSHKSQHCCTLLENLANTGQGVATLIAKQDAVQIRRDFPHLLKYVAPMETLNQANQNTGLDFSTQPLGRDFYIEAVLSGVIPEGAF